MEKNKSIVVEEKLVKGKLLRRDENEFAELSKGLSVRT